MSRRHLAVAALAVLSTAAGAQEPSPAPPASPPPASPPAEPPPGAPPPGQGPTFPAEVELVTVDVVVTDKKGGPITDLKREDFVVEEDGKPQSVASFEAVVLPATASGTPPPKPRVSTNTAKEIQTGRTFVIVFDDVHLTPQHAQRAKAAIGEFLKSGVREGDRVALLATGGGVWWSTRMEAGRDELIAILKRLDGRHIPDFSPDRVSDYEAMRIHVYRDQQIIDRVRRRFDTYGASGVGTDQRERYGYEDPQVLARAADVYFQSVARNRITLETLERTLMSLRSTKGRKSLILVSEGFIYDPNLDDFKRVVQATRRSNVAIYFLDTRGLGGMPVYMTAQYGPALDTQDIGAAFMENYEASEGSESLAADSGGFTVKNTNDLNKGIQRIADESRAYYLIGYNPTNTARDGRFRKISVKVARKGVQVRARKGYYAPLDGGGALVARKPGAGDPDIQAALDSPYEETDIPLRMTAFTFDETLLGKASVVVATEVDLTRFAFDEKEARFVDTMEFLLVVAHRESGEYFRYDQKVDMNLRPETREKVARTWYPIARDFELAPGGYQAKIVVRDKNSGKIGTVIHEFEVPDLSQLRTSTLILSDTVQPQGETATDNRPRPALLVRRDFPQGAMLYASFEVYGAARDKGGSLPRVAAGHVIRKSDGTVYNTKSATLITPTSLGKLSRLLGLSLEGAEPGEYEFVLNVTDQVAGKDLEVREPFRVVPAEAPAASGS